MTFSSMRREEFKNLFDYCKAKDLPVESLEETGKQGAMRLSQAVQLEDNGDAYMNRIDNESLDFYYFLFKKDEMEEDSDEDDSDFKASESASDSEEYSSRSRESSSDKDSGGSDADDGEKKSSKKKSSKKKAKDLENPVAKKPKKNLRNRSVSPFSNFSRKIREEIKEELENLDDDAANELVSEKWNSLSVEEKEKY